MYPDFFYQVLLVGGFQTGGSRQTGHKTARSPVAESFSSFVSLFHDLWVETLKSLFDQKRHENSLDHRGNRLWVVLEGPFMKCLKL